MNSIPQPQSKKRPVIDVHDVCEAESSRIAWDQEAFPARDGWWPTAARELYKIVGAPLSLQPPDGWRVPLGSMDNTERNLSIKLEREEGMFGGIATIRGAYYKEDLLIAACWQDRAGGESVWPIVSERYLEAWDSWFAAFYDPLRRAKLVLTAGASLPDPGFSEPEIRNKAWQGVIAPLPRFYRGEGATVMPMTQSLLSRRFANMAMVAMLEVPGAGLPRAAR
jgi:hypothetical protein